MRNANIFCLLLVIAVTGGLIASCTPGKTIQEQHQPKAAIIDQLYLLDPNPELITHLTGALETGGYKVDVCQGQGITVDYLRNLPQHNYKVIIFRAHLGILSLVSIKDKNRIIPAQITGLFTGENYSTLKYGSDQMRGRVYEGVMNEKYPPLFSIGAEFIKEGMNGQFDGTVILMMGCASLYNDDLARAFIEKGATTYIGWDATVTLNYLDTATGKLVDNLLSGSSPLALGISKTILDAGTDPHFGSRLKFLSTAGGDLTLQELTGNAG